MQVSHLLQLLTKQLHYFYANRANNVIAYITLLLKTNNVITLLLKANNVITYITLI